MCMSKLVLVLLVLILAFVGDTLLTLGVQYAASGLFHKTLPFWPTFVAIFVVSYVLGRLRK